MNITIEELEVKLWEMIRAQQEKGTIVANGDMIGNLILEFQPQYRFRDCPEDKPCLCLLGVIGDGVFSFFKKNDFDLSFEELSALEDGFENYFPDEMNEHCKVLYALGAKIAQELKNGKKPRENPFFPLLKTVQNQP